MMTQEITENEGLKNPTCSPSIASIDDVESRRAAVHGGRRTNAMARARTIKQTFKQSKNDDASRRGKARAIAWKRIGDRASEEDDEGEVEKDLRELKQFDLTMKYGPCTGMTRLERYDRAVANGLAPPPRVLEIIHRRGSDGRWTECLWYGTAVDML